MKKMPVGIDDFKTLRDGDYYFVDKTGVIGELIDGHGQVTLITRPRRFGKTLIMSMLERFFSLSYTDSFPLFDHLAITTAGESYMRHQGHYPVIFLTLKDAKLLRYNEVSDILYRKISDLYGRYVYLLESPALNDQDKSYFRQVYHYNGQVEGAAAMMALSIAKLSEFLYKHHQVKTILLIDEYDAPVEQAWECGFYEEMIAFMRTFLGAALKTNPSLQFAVLTGVLRIAKESIFYEGSQSEPLHIRGSKSLRYQEPLISALNNLEVSCVSGGSYADVFGFTSDEVRRMADDLGVPEKMGEIREWYDGYSFSGHEIYNPWSVINYFKRGCEAAPYWVNTSGNSILKVMLAHIDEQRRSELYNLVNGNPVMAAIKEGVIYPDIYKDRDALYSMLLTTGYLKCVETQRRYGQEWGKLTIPNNEVRSVFNHEILQNMAGGIGESTLYIMIEAMLDGRTEVFESNLRTLLRETVSIHDAAHPESFYHGMMLGFSVLLSGRYTVKSNRESGYGRFDLALIPQEPGHPGVIMEFKTAKNAYDLKAKAMQGLKQIEDKAYITELQGKNILSVCKYGVAFCGKRVHIERG